MKPLPVAIPWFNASRMGDGIVRLTEPHVARLWRANVFLVRGRDRDLLVDSGLGVGDLRAALAPFLDKPLLVFTTHAHLDHIGGHREFRDTEILVHPAEAARLADPGGPAGLSYAGFDDATRAAYAAAGFATDGLFVDAIPAAGYQPAAHRFEGVAATRLVDEGDTVDLGDRAFTVLHLPGHSPGSIALWDAARGTLIAGDALYDGVLVDSTADANIPDYLRTMRRLRDLPVRVVHGGHREVFGRERMLAIIDAYIASRTAASPAPPRGKIGF